MLIRHSLYAGLITGTGLLAGVLAAVIWRGVTGGTAVQFLPAVFVPLVVTGIIAVRRASPWIRSPLDAARSGALAGTATGLVSIPIFYLGLALNVFVLGLGTVPWDGFIQILSSIPFSIPRDRLVVDLPFQLPFWWPISRIVAPGVTISQIPTVWLLFVPIGMSLSALQAWLYYVVVRQVRLDLWAVRNVARYRAPFERKLMLGFVILGLMIFAVGWLGYAAVEEMHSSLHVGRVLQHNVDHIVRIQANLRTESDGLARAADDPNSANLQAVTASAKLITDELAHMKQVPPASHPADISGSGLMAEASRRLPAVREADARFAEYSRGIGDVVDLLRAGNTSEARSQLEALEPSRRAMDTAIFALTNDLNRDLLAWSAQMDNARHSQEPIMLIIVLLAAGVAFPLGYVLSQVVVRPVSQVSGGLRRIGSGDFSSHIGVENRDELGELAERVNQMNDELARLYDELQARTRELARSVQEQRALAEISLAVSSSLDLQTVLNTIVGQAVRLSSTDAGAIYELDEATQTFKLQVTHQMSDEMVAGIRGTTIRLDDPVIGLAARTRAAVQVADIQTEPPFPVQDILLGAGFRSVLAVPLLREDRIVGALVVRRKAPGELDAESVDLLQAFATQSVLAIQNARLFQEVEETGCQLQIASQHKSQFLANMSHELRTPLNAILGYTELIVDGIYGEPPEKIRDVLERVEKSGRHLLGLINDVLDLSKMEAGQLDLTLEDYSLGQVVQTAVIALESLAAEKQLALTMELAPDLPVGRGDERRLTQVLLNLVGNAIKFTEVGRVMVVATCDNDTFVVSVTDTGTGISVADQHKIFEEFQQADSTSTRQQGGTGLGLAIARRIVELHGGHLGVESRMGEGSTFTCAFPVCAARREVAA